MNKENEYKYLGIKKCGAIVDLETNKDAKIKPLIITSDNKIRTRGWCTDLKNMIFTIITKH